MAALGELAHRSLSRLTRIGDDGPHPRRLEQNPFTDAVAGDLHFTRLEPRHHLGDDRQPGDNDVGAIGVESLDTATLRGTHRVQHLEQVFDVAARNARGMNASCREDALPR